MNLRERVLAVLNGKQPDYVPWLGDLAYWVHYLESSGLMPEQYKNEGLYRLHRDLGVGFYLQGYSPYRAVTEDITVETTDDGVTRTTHVSTPAGVLRQVEKHLPESYCCGCTEHFVKSPEDLKILRSWMENTRYEPHYQLAARRYDLIGDHGVVLCYLPRSPLMQMVAQFAGIENTTYLMLDAPDEFEETMALLRQKADEAALLSLLSPAECLMIPENLSSEVVGKSLFHQYMRPYEEYWNRKIKEAGKYSFVHMDGTMQGLIRETSQTGFRVLEALTPAPVGDIPMAEIHNWVEPDTIIWGGIPGGYFTDLLSDGDFDDFVISLLDIMKTEPRYVLGVADQVPPGARWERIRRVSELVAAFGRY